MEEIPAEDFGYAENEMTVWNGLEDFFAGKRPQGDSEATPRILLPFSGLPANTVPNLLQLLALGSCRTLKSNLVQYQARQAGRQNGQNDRLTARLFPVNGSLFSFDAV